MVLCIFDEGFDGIYLGLEGLIVFVCSVCLGVFDKALYGLYLALESFSVWWLSGVLGGEEGCLWGVGVYVEGVCYGSLGSVCRCDGEGGDVFAGGGEGFGEDVFCEFFLLSFGGDYFPFVLLDCVVVCFGCCVKFYFLFECWCCWVYGDFGDDVGYCEGCCGCLCVSFCIGDGEGCSVVAFFCVLLGYCFWSFFCYFFGCSEVPLVAGDGCVVFWFGSGWVEDESLLCFLGGELEGVLGVLSVDGEEGSCGAGDCYGGECCLSVVCKFVSFWVLEANVEVEVVYSLCGYFVFLFGSVSNVFAGSVWECDCPFVVGVFEGEVWGGGVACGCVEVYGVGYFFGMRGCR